MNLKVRLAVMNFLEFAVWGAYLTSMGNYLGKAGMGAEISWFYTIQGIVSIFMPTLALSNTSAFSILKSNGLDTVKAFPPIRVFGTVGFILTMWIVNCATWDNGSFSFLLSENAHKFQYTHYQFLVSGVLSILLFLYCFSLPACPIVKKETKSWVETWGFDAFKLFKSREMAMFFIFSCMLGMSLQVTNGYATPFITSFKGDPAMLDTFAANNATLLVSISQVAEALCILLIPFFLKRYGIKVVMLIAMMAWVLRFGFFGLGNPAFPGVTFFILSCIVYGVAFDFFNVSGGLFVDQKCDVKVRASAQGLFMLMTNGLGASIGTILAGMVINHYCHWTDDGYLMGDWKTCWFIFAGYALVVAVAFAVLFRPKKEQK